MSYLAADNSIHRIYANSSSSSSILLNSIKGRNSKPLSDASFNEKSFQSYSEWERTEIIIPRAALDLQKKRGASFSVIWANDP